MTHHQDLRLRRASTATLATALVVGGMFALAATRADATPLTVSQPFVQYFNVAANSLGFTTGERIRFGASSVIPNGDAVPPTTGVATTVNTVTGAVFSRSITFNPDTASPNLFSRTIVDDPALHGPWTLAFTNGPDSFSRTLSLPTGFTQQGFISSLTVSGSSLNPTFTWAPPTAGVTNGYRVNLYDRDRLTSTGRADGVYSINLATPSFTVPTALAGGLVLDPTHRYSIEIAAMRTRDGGSRDLGNGNVAALSRTYFDFRPIASTAPEVFLPAVSADGRFRFDVPVLAGVPVFIDPEVATGYDYVVGAGDPNFASVLLPVGIGDGLYDVYAVASDGAATLLISDLAGGTTFAFAPGGLAHFRVTGIETEAGLDPADASAFVTGLTFTGDGRFTGTQTPIVAFVDAPTVPAPASGLLLGVALLGLLGRGNAARSSAR